MCIVVAARPPVIRQKLPGYVRQQGYCVLVPAGCLCSVSTASPLGRCLTKVPSFPRRRRRPRGKRTSVQLLCNYRTHGDSASHPYLVIVLLGLVDNSNRLISTFSRWWELTSELKVHRLLMCILVRSQTSNSTCLYDKTSRISQCMRHSQAFPACLGI